MAKKQAKWEKKRRREKIVHGRPNYSYQNGDAPEGEVNTNYKHYVTARNHEVIFLPMPPMLRDNIRAGLNAKWPEPTEPTYEVETAAGDTEVHRHTEKSLVTDEDKVAWDAYQSEKQAWDAEFGRRFLRGLQIECIEFAEKEGWEEKQKFLGFAIPTDNPFERRLHYIQSEIIGDEDDVLMCFMAPMELAGMEDEQLAAAENLFRTSIRQEALKPANRESTEG